MVARAHAVHDYSFAGVPARPRRQIWLQEDEKVVLPRGRSESRSSAALVISALLASALVVGATYGIYRTAPPELAETPTAPLTSSWQPDAMQMQARSTNALLGPARAVPGVAGAVPTEPMNLGAEDTSSSDSREVVIDDSAPGLQESLPQPGIDSRSLAPAPVTPQENPPSAAPAAPYPNPTTTPPEMMEPSTTTPAAPSIKPEPENPY